MRSTRHAVLSSCPQKFAPTALALQSSLRNLPATLSKASIARFQQFVSEVCVHRSRKLCVWFAQPESVQICFCCCCFVRVGSIEKQSSL